MVELCAEIEATASQKNSEQAKRLIEKLKRRFERVRGIIHSRMEQGLN